MGLMAGGAHSGNLDAPAAPDNAGSAMYTLDDLYQRLVDGSDGTKRGATYAEPDSGPSAGTMHTLNDIMGEMPAVDESDGAAAENVLQGKNFWGLLPDGGWGPQTGTLETPPPPCNCKGTIWNEEGGGTRWCDNGDGTVTDLLGATVDGKIKGRCLVWLKDAGWGGETAWWTDFPTQGRVPYDANTRAGILLDGKAGLHDGSVLGDWRLSTFSELRALTTDPQRILSGTSGPFSDVKSYGYWSSTPWDDGPSGPAGALYVNLDTGDYNYTFKKNALYVWPVRGGQ